MLANILYMGQAHEAETSGNFTCLLLRKKKRTYHILYKPRQLLHLRTKHLDEISPNQDHPTF